MEAAAAAALLTYIVTVYQASVMAALASAYSGAALDVQTRLAAISVAA